MSTHSIHQTFWSAVVDKQALTVLQSSGLVLGVCGVAVISLAVYIERMVRCCGGGESKGNKIQDESVEVTPIKEA